MDNLRWNDDMSDNLKNFNPDRNYYRANFDQINLDLLETNWEQYLDCNDVNSMLSLFYSKIYSNVNENVPLRTHRIHSFPSWFSSNLIN